MTIFIKKLTSSSMKRAAIERSEKMNVMLQ